jgi:hypothetical protein
MKKKSLTSLIVFSLFFWFSHTAVAKTNTPEVSQELASLVQQADDFLTHSQSLAVLEMNPNYLWYGENIFFVTFVSLFSLICFIIITSQYVITEGNRRPVRK